MCCFHDLDWCIYFVTLSSPSNWANWSTESKLLFLFLLTVLVFASAFTREGWAGITNCVDHVSYGGTPGSTVLCELTRHFHAVLSPLCVAEDSRSGDRFQVGLDRGSPCLQLASSSSAPRARWCRKEKVLDQLTFGTSCERTIARVIHVTLKLFWSIFFTAWTYLKQNARSWSA